ncbi:MAG: hypothetical protein ACJA2S_003559 [Cyclobacteriaceae bacterium]|jgi:hypothetical protein
MKKLILIFPMLFLVLFADAQKKKVKERDLDGVWKLVIKIDKEEIADELDDEDNIFAKIIAKSVVGIVDDVLNEIDIRFEFKSNNRLKVTVNAFGEEEFEYSEWKINNKGQLIIENIDSFDSEEDYWLFEGDILVAYDNDDDGPSENIYLVNMD